MIAGHCQAPSPHLPDWQILRIHGNYALQLLQALELAQHGDDADAQAAIAKMLDDINREEWSMQQVMDGNKAKMHWSRRLDRSKCTQVDVL